MFSKDQLKELAPKLQKVEEDRLAQRYEYLGLLSEYQLYLKESKQQLVYSKLNPKQHFLFKRILHGLKMYKKEEVEKMHWDKKRRITKVWKKGQNILNEFKQFITYKQMQPLFCIFAKSELGRAIHEMPFEYMPDYKNKMTLQELGINYEDVILKFMSVGLLPKNYLSVK
tara:strand:+ start:525 stop:1034 length:510 start_codon:yes stop_codon:yes gene_type:complete